MPEQAWATDQLTVPISDLGLSDPCIKFRSLATFGGYLGVGDVNGVDYDHIALTSPTVDYQIWLDRSTKPVPLRIVINYRAEPGSLGYIAVLSHLKFRKSYHPASFGAAAAENGRA
jgi:hypothetical protein